MSLHWAKLFFMVVALSLFSSDAFAQRGGRSAPGNDSSAKQDSEENGQQSGRRGRRGGGTMQADGAPGSSSAGPGQAGQPAGQPAGRGSAAGGPSGRFGTGAAGATNPLFAALDADSDGLISKSEMENAILAFARLDEDKDGMLSMEEAGATGGGGHSHGGGMAGRGGARGVGGEQTDGIPQGLSGAGRGGRGRMQAPGSAANPDSMKGDKDDNAVANSKSGSPFDKK